MTGFVPAPAALPRGWVPAPPTEASWVRDPTVLARWMAEAGTPPRSRSGTGSVIEAVIALHALGEIPPRSTDWEAGLSDYPRHAAGCLSRAGIAPADMIAMVRAAGLSTNEDLMVCASIVRTLLRAVTRDWAAMPLRDAIGWYLCLGEATRDLPDPGQAWVDPIEAWAHAGLAFVGWRYFAAGFTVEEAVAGLAAQTVDWDRAHVLAGLRGAALPA